MAPQSSHERMNTRQIKTLTLVLLVLVAGIYTNTISNNGDSSAGALLFPDLRAEINDISRVSISSAGESVTLKRDADQWVLAEYKNYPVDTGKLRQLILTLADAKKLEEKTSKVEMYGRLGVEDTSDDSLSTEIRLDTPDSARTLIIGNLAQRKYRYARIAGEATSWLIDQNPTLPSDLSDWLLPEILNIDSSRIQFVTITHSDGETINIHKEDAAVTDYSVSDIPDGRELSYPSIVDGMAGVVSGLNLEDVVESSIEAQDDSAATTVFKTFEGLEITIKSSIRDENSWITVSANQPDASSEEATKINERVGGWAYQIQSYKADQLRRRWDDILKAEE
jgi:Domain of unknown function (DUF4340)